MIVKDYKRRLNTNLTKIQNNTTRITIVLTKHQRTHSFAYVSIESNLDRRLTLSPTAEIPVQGVHTHLYVI